MSESIAPIPGEYTLRYLSGGDVARCMPSVERQLELAEQSVLALARREGQNPPKVALHLDAGGETFLHAMPAYHEPSGALGMKWVSGYPDNRTHGLPFILGLIILNDPETGRPTCVMDCREITGRRTAAISGVAIARLAPREVSTVAIIGTGVQARTHLAVLTHLLPPVDLVVCDAFPEAAEAYADFARASAGVRSVRVADSVLETIESADIVITAGTVHSHFQDSIRPELMKDDVLVVAVDWTTLVKGPTVQAADLFVVDDVEQYHYHKGFGIEFVGCPDEAATLGDLVANGVTRETRPAGLAIAMPLGVGMADILYAREILATAMEQGVGVDLEL